MSDSQQRTSDTAFFFEIGRNFRAPHFANGALNQRAVGEPRELVSNELTDVWGDNTIAVGEGFVDLLRVNVLARWPPLYLIPHRASLS